VGPRAVLDNVEEGKYLTFAIKRKSVTQKDTNSPNFLNPLLQRTQGRKKHNAVKYLAYIILSFVFREIWYARTILFLALVKGIKLKSK
jgi:hypothetical protein